MRQIIIKKICLFETHGFKNLIQLIELIIKCDSAVLQVNILRIFQKHMNWNMTPNTQNIILAYEIVYKYSAWSVESEKSS